MGADGYSTFFSCRGECRDDASGFRYFTCKMCPRGEVIRGGRVNCTISTVYSTSSPVKVDLEFRYVYQGDARILLVILFGFLFRMCGCDEVCVLLFCTGMHQRLMLQSDAKFIYAERQCVWPGPMHLYPTWCTPPHNSCTSHLLSKSKAFQLDTNP